MKIAVLGAGAWGTALALCFNRNPNIKVTLITIEEDHLIELKNTHENFTFLPGIKIPNEIDFSMEIPKDIDILFSAGPAQAIEDISKRLLDELKPEIPVILCSKGTVYQNEKAKVQTEIASEYIKNPLFVLSGPTFAKEVANAVPSFSIIAGRDKKLCNDLKTHLSHDTMKLQTSSDIYGVQIAGSMKNIFAIGNGILKGLHFGFNTQYAFFAQCMQEMIAVGKIHKAKEETFLGLSGVSDLLMTCSNAMSRNTALGFALAAGEHYETYSNQKKAIIEGAFTAKVIFDTKGDLSLPICEFVYECVFTDIKDIKQRALDLMQHKNYLS